MEQDVGSHSLSVWRVSATLAWRYLWRSYRRTSIMLLAIAVAVWAMIFMIAILRGMVNEMVDTSLHNFLGEVQIHHPDYLDDPSVVNSMPPPSGKLLSALEQSGAHWASRLRVPSVVSSERESLGVILMGVQPAREAGLSRIASQISRGRFLESGDDQGIVIGAKLARRLDTDLGKRIVLMSQDRNNNIADRGFRVVGIYRAELEATEEQFVFVGLGTAQTLLGVDEGVDEGEGGAISEIEIQRGDYRNADSLYRQIQPAAANLDVKSWQQLDTYLGTMIGVMDGFVLVWIIVMFLAMSFGLVNTLVMAVFERVREIGLILALGMRPSAIVRQVLLETLYLLLLGLLMGNLLAWLTLWPMRDGVDLSSMSEGMAMMGVGTTLTPALYTDDLVMSNVIVIVLGLLAGLLPAIRASRYDPVRALNKI